MTAVYGFAGLNFTDHITLNPKLPPSFESLSFQIKYRKKQYKIDISQQDATIQEVLT
jgi:trehalose/maltose hydrolase-like predicted phosphorylase